MLRPLPHQRTKQVHARSFRETLLERGSPTEGHLRELAACRQRSSPGARRAGHKSEIQMLKAALEWRFAERL